MDPSDADVIERWRAGDPAAFALLVRRWQRRMARFLVHITNRSDVAADLCQEVFLRVYQAGPRYRECGQFSAWLSRIALNVARDFTRRRLPHTLPLPSCNSATYGLAPDAICEQRETSKLVAEAVAELPEALRLVLVLRHYEEMSFEEIARLTATPSSTLKSRFTAALNQLRTRLHHLACESEENHR